ncbi:hypothetical protein DPX16_15619 [Anabarilius grahami]|uniref:Uncharacterized protein n=1 Tax=Anabarilius grahami TaxID=495550 RepID=A0A3N0YD14_ANAGA|nr:hypothetical protein DPX16_15619 [Anabarilius grahami]
MGGKNLLLDAAKLKFPNSAKSISLERFNKIYKLCAWNVWDCVADGQQYCRANEKQSVSSSDMLRGRAEVTTHTLINIALISGQVSICWASSLVYKDISACWGHRTHDSVVMDCSVVQWMLSLKVKVKVTYKIISTYLISPGMPRLETGTTDTLGEYTVCLGCGRGGEAVLCALAAIRGMEQ